MCVHGGAVIGQCAVDLGDAAWPLGLAGACALGPHLLVPTDDGIVRLEVVAGAIAVTRRFVETAPLCAAVDTLSIHRDGLALHKAGAALPLTTGPARAVVLAFTARAAGQES